MNPIADADDVPLIVAEQISIAVGNDWAAITPEKKKELGSDKKKLLNTKAIEKMTVARITERGGFDEICLWLNTIKQFTA